MLSWKLSNKSILLLLKALSNQSHQKFCQRGSKIWFLWSKQMKEDITCQFTLLWLVIHLKALKLSLPPSMSPQCVTRKEMNYVLVPSCDVQLNYFHFIRTCCEPSRTWESQWCMGSDITVRATSQRTIMSSS